MNREQLKKFENDLWAAADKLRANSDLKASEYGTPVLGLIFLKFADNKYRQFEDAILAEYQQLKSTRRERSLQDIAIEKCGFALGPAARYDYLLNLPEKENIPKAIRAAMASIENSKPELLGVLPQQEYDRFNRSEQNRGIPKALLKLFSDIPLDASGDVFGQIYEYFLANFAMSEGQGGGEFFTPRSVVRLMVEVIEPHGGKPVMDAFESIAEPMLTAALKLKQANRRLSETRDALLPRLISGKLKVDHLDICLPPSMQDEATA